SPAAASSASTRRRCAPRRSTRPSACGPPCPNGTGSGSRPISSPHSRTRRSTSIFADGRTPPSRMRSLLRVVAINVLVLAAPLVGAGGLASSLLVGRQVLQAHHGPAERRHTRYDRELGWVNIPNLDIPDMYGPGVRLRTNGQGFRNDHDIAETVPPGKQ